MTNKNIIFVQTSKDVKSSVIHHKGELYTYYDSGLSRHVFVNDDKTKVIKIPINPSSQFFNDEEYEVYLNASDTVKSKLVKTEIHNGIIEQEYVTPIKYSDKKLSIPQIIFARSCRDEVGWDKEGNLVCFDLSEYKKY